MVNYVTVCIFQNSKVYNYLQKTKFFLRFFQNGFVNVGFAMEEDARMVAELVIKKIRNNELPTTVTIEELRKLGVL